MRNTLQLKINCNFTYSLRNKYSTCYIYMISQLQRTSFICQLRLQCSCILNTSLDVAVKFWLWVKQITLYNVDRSHSISWKEWGALKRVNSTSRLPSDLSCNIYPSGRLHLYPYPWQFCICQSPYSVNQFLKMSLCIHTHFLLILFLWRTLTNT